MTSSHYLPAVRISTSIVVCSLSYSISYFQRHVGEWNSRASSHLSYLWALFSVYVFPQCYSWIQISKCIRKRESRELRLFSTSVLRSPSLSALGFCHVRSCWQLTNCCVKGNASPHKIPDPAIRREKTSVSNRERIFAEILCFFQVTQIYFRVQWCSPSPSWASSGTHPPHTLPNLLLLYSCLCASNH